MADSSDHDGTPDATLKEAKVLKGQLPGGANYSIRVDPNMKIGGMIPLTGQGQFAFMIVPAIESAVGPYNVLSNLTRRRILSWAREYSDKMAHHFGLLSGEAWALTGLPDA